MSQVLPEAILSKLSAKDRKAIGQPTAAEAQGKYEAGQEKRLQTDLANFLTHARVYFFRQPMNKRAQGKLGTADFLICYKGYWISTELKTCTGKQRPEQIQDQVFVEASGGIYLLARSVAEVQNEFRRIDAVIRITQAALAKTGWTAKP